MITKSFCVSVELPNPGPKQSPYKLKDSKIFMDIEMSPKSSPLWSMKTSIFLVAPIPKCQLPELTNSVQEGPSAGVPCGQGHVGTVQHWSYLKGGLKPNLMIDLVDHQSNYFNYYMH